MRSNTEILRTRKDSLARLLATEDLVIEHKKVPTAYFEPKNRKLVCPILKDDMSNQLYDLFMGHEVGHALITPADGWHDAVCEKGATYKGYLNVLEDIRIEKHIKNKYAGLRRIFYDAYKELHVDLDFFGVKNYDVNKLAFIDRINLYFKIGHKLMVEFSPEEQKLVTMMDTKMDTWEKVVKMADYLYELSKLEDLQPQTDTNAQSVETSEGDGEAIPQDFDEREQEGDAEDSIGGDMESEEESEEKGEEDSTKGAEDSDEDAEEGDKESEETGEGEEEKGRNLKGGEGEGGQSGNAEDTPNESITDKNFRNNEDKLHKDLDNWEREPAYIEFNSKEVKFKDLVLPYKRVMSEITSSFAQQDSQYCDTLANSREYTQKFFDFNKNIINYMAKEFDMRKAADAYKKSMSAKTGEIDMSRIHQYLLKDDIFKRATVIPDGKNHGVIMLVDWSGSMYDVIRETYEQTIVLTMFCRRVGIPHRVYAFTDAYRDKNIDYRNEADEFERFKFQPKSGFRLIELFSDKMNKKDFFDGAVVMNAQLESMCNGRSYYYHGAGKGDRFEADYGQDYNYSLGGTPLDESLMVIRDYIADFKHNYGIDKLQFVTLTDGQSFQLGCFPYSDDKFFHDRRTKNTYAYTKKGSRRGTDNLLKWIEQTTGVDTVGFFICKNSHRDFDSAVDMFSGEYQDWDTKQDGYKVFRKEGGYSVPTTEKSGYKEFYILNKRKMGIVSEDDTLDVDAGASKQALKGAMKRMGNNKMSQRKILQHFVKKVA
tara:strand:+ start:8765 stop:11065 length:2301 start_codon:yes stop_codon:yes gene_type:complete